MTDRFVVGVVAGAIGLMGGMAVNSALLALSPSAVSVQANRKPVFRTGFECRDGDPSVVEPSEPESLRGIPIGFLVATPGTAGRLAAGLRISH